MSALLNDRENKTAAKFAVDHHGCGDQKRAEININAHHTGVGFKLDMKCKHCKAALDITDYKSW